MSILLVPAGRTLAGFISALVLAFVGDLTGRVVNLTLGYPWSLEIHITLHMVCIGLGAGIGAYLGWISLRWNRYMAAGVLALVLAVSIVGVYVGLEYGPGVDPTYWWSRFALDPYIHVIAAAHGTVVATLIGLVQQWFYLKQDQSRYARSHMTNLGSIHSDQEQVPSN